MSRAFVKDADAIDELPDRPISGHTNEVTREGLRQIESVLTAAQEAYTAAQQVGDREGLASAGRDLRYWTARRSTAVVVPEPQDNSIVRFGHTVTIARDDGRSRSSGSLDRTRPTQRAGQSRMFLLLRVRCSARRSVTSCQSPAGTPRSLASAEQWHDR